MRVVEMASIQRIPFLKSRWHIELPCPEALGIVVFRSLWRHQSHSRDRLNMLERAVATGVKVAILESDPVAVVT